MRSRRKRPPPVYDRPLTKPERIRMKIRKSEMTMFDELPEAIRTYINEAARAVDLTVIPAEIRKAEGNIDQVITKLRRYYG